MVVVLDSLRVVGDASQISGLFKSHYGTETDKQKGADSSDELRKVRLRVSAGCPYSLVFDDDDDTDARVGGDASAERIPWGEEMMLVVNEVDNTRVNGQLTELDTDDTERRWL